MTMTGGNSQTSDATLIFDTAHSTIGTCSGNSSLCSSWSTWYFAYPDLERFHMTASITYDAILGKLKIAGTAVAADVGGSTSGNFWYSYTFTGFED